MIKRLRAEDGMTIAEVLAAVTVGFIVLAAALGLLESTVRLNTGVMAKTDAMQRGRLAMDRITQELRSQVCLNLTTPAILAGGTADSITYYSDFGAGDVSKAPSKRTLTFDPATGLITATIISGAGPDGGPWTYDTPARKHVIYENATRVVKGGTPVPFMRFFAFEETGTPPVLRTSLELAPPLDAAEAARVARIEISFGARPTNAKDDKNATDVQDQITVRHADPNLTVPDPMCV